MAATAVAVPVVAIGGTIASPVSATNTLIPTTSFTIDGNRDGANDFASPYGPGTTPDTHPTTGLYGVRQIIDNALVPAEPDGCAYVGDDAADSSTGKVEDGPVWLAGGPTPNGKTDINFIDFASEKVDVAGQINDILYVGYEKCGGNGTWQTLLTVDDGDGVAKSEGDQDGDFLFVFDFDPSSGSVTFKQYLLSGGTYSEDTTTPAGAIEGSAAGNYGEVALNLTSLGIIGGAEPPDQSNSCDSISISGQSAAITGGSLTSAVKDIMIVPPFDISNCGALTVTKLSDPAGVVSPDQFHYLVDQLDGAPAHDDSLTPSGLGDPADTTEPDADNTELDAIIRVGETHTWTNVISQPDYFLDEDVVPAGWDNVRVVCTYTDIISDPSGQTMATAVLLSTVDGEPTDPDFLIPPARFNDMDIAPASCEITNATSGVTITKAGAGDPAQPFDFTITGGSTQLMLGETSEVFSFTPGTDVTLSETLPATTPAWSLDSVVCTDGDGGNVWDSAVDGGNEPTFTTISGTVIDCVFTNHQAARIDVTKVTDPAGTTDEFTFGIDNGATLADDTLADGDSTTTGDIAPGTYTITETVVDGWMLTGVDCGDWAAGDTDTTVTLAAGDVANCTFTNTQNGEITVAKQTVDGNDTFTFTGDVTGDITTVGGVTPAGSELAADVAPGTYSVGETVPAGWTLTGTSCTDGSPVDAIDVTAGESVECTFVNTRNSATLTLAKSWGDTTPDGEVVELDAAVAAGAGPIDDPIDVDATSAGAPNSDYSPADRSMTVYSGQTIDLAEAFAIPGNADGFTTVLNCTAPGTDGSMNIALDNRSAVYVVGSDPVDVTCTFVNTPKVAGVTLQKTWVDAETEPADTADLAAINDAGPADGALSTADQATFTDTENTAVVTVQQGDTVTFTETLSNQANYTTTFTCANADTGGDDPTNSPVQVNEHEWTLLIDTTDVTESSAIICEFVNTRDQIDLTLAKSWVDAVVDDEVLVSATGSDAGDINFGSVADTATETDTGTPGTVLAGETVALAESWVAGDPAAYDTTLSCTGAADTDLGDGLTVASGEEITCTWVNARRSIDVQVAKEVNPAGDDGTFDISLNGNVELTGVGDSADDPDATSGPVSILVGDTVGLSEAGADGTDLANYTSTLACDNGVTIDNNIGTAGSFGMPASLADGTTVTCLFTNTRNQVDLLVTKSWADSPVNGDTVALTITGGAATATDGEHSNNATDDDNDAFSVVYAGETITVTEGFDVGDAANYDTTLVCADADGNLVDSSGTLNGEFTVAAAPTDIVCTFTNTRKSAELTLRKNWVNAQTGDTAAMSIGGEASGGTDTDEATSTANGGTETDNTNVASLTVFSGETVDFNEILADADSNDATSKYASNLLCNNNAGAVTNNGTSGSLAIVPADSGAAISCRFRNDRKSVDLELVKSWGVSPANGDAVDLAITGGLQAGTDGMNSNDGDDANDSTATVRAFYGDTLALTEAFNPGTPAWYATDLDCASIDGLLTYTDGALAGDLFVDPDDQTINDATLDGQTVLTCTFTNERRSTDLVLQKQWDDAVADDTADLSVSGEDGTGDATSTAPDGDALDTTNTASIVVYAGETVDLSETVNAASASYDSSLACAGNENDPVYGDGTTTDATLAITVGDTDGEGIVCTFTNRALRGNIIVVKNVDGADGTFDFTGSWPEVADDGFSITTSSGTGNVVYNGVLVPAGGSYDIAEIDPRPEYDGTTLTCTDTVDGGTASTGATEQPLEGTIGLDDGETVTCTFTNVQRGTIVVVKDAVPDASTDFGFTSTFSDPFTLDDDADGTLPNMFTSALLAPGEYSITELATAGWTLDPASSCSDATVVDGDTFNLSLGAGQTITCTFVNDANPAGLNVTKSVGGMADGAPWGPFTFTLSGGSFTGDASQNVDSGNPTAQWTDLIEGATYTLAESDAVGFTEGEFVCTVIPAGSDQAEPLADADDGTDGFQFVASAGATYSCDITNTADPAEVTVVKTVTNVAAGFAWSFDITIAPDPDGDGGQDATQSVSGTGPSSDSVTWTGLLPGETYSLTESDVAGFTEGEIVCVGLEDADAETAGFQFVAQPGTPVSCSLTNTADPAEVTVVKTVTNVAAGFAWSFDITIAPDPDGDGGQDATQSVSGTGPSSDSVTWTGLLPGETYSLTESDVAGFTEGEIVCVGLEDADAETAGFQFVAQPGTPVSCSLTNTADPAEVTVVKTVTNVAAGFAWSFDITIAPDPDGDGGQDATQSVSGTGPSSDSVTWTGLLPGETYSLTESDVAGFTEGEIVCVGLEDADAETAGFQFVAQPGTPVSCSLTNRADPGRVQITKSVTNVASGATWSFEFTISPVPGGQTSPKTATKNAPTVAWNGLVPGTTYTVGETTVDGFTARTMTCSGVQDSDNNPQTVTFVAQPGVSVSCSITNRAQSDVSWNKRIDPNNPPVRNPNGTWTINYLIRVDNDGPGIGVYDLADEFNFGDGVTPINGSVNNTQPGGIATNDGFSGVAPNTTIVTGQSIASGATHVYRVTASAAVDVSGPVDNDCAHQPGDGTGFLNEMTISVDGGDPATDEACRGFAVLRLVKQVDNGDGGNAKPADFTLTAAGTAATISAPAAVASAVPAGTYTLSETQVAGYTTTGFDCGNAEQNGNKVTVNNGDDITCVIVNDDLPVDLRVTKTDGDARAVAGGDPFTYTITVRNVGDRDADPGEAITVTDELPAGLTWVSVPDTCNRSGQTVTCELDPAKLTVGGSVTLKMRARAAASTPSGIYTNVVVVTTDDDPVCVGAGCEPPPCPANGNNNVDCEETPVPREGDIEIVKVDNVGDGETVQPGDTYSYTLRVTNTGVSTILPGLEVTDNLPNQLELVSVTANDAWTCNDADPVACTYGPALAPGATAPPITIEVAVATDVSVDAIDNVAKVAGAVDFDCADEQGAVADACDVVTDEDDETTPVTAQADLRIVKTSDIDHVGIGTEFTWTLKVDNLGPGVANDVVVSDTLPSEVRIEGVAADGFECGFEGQDVTCTRARMVLGASGTIDIRVTVTGRTESGIVSNLGRVDAETPDPNDDNNIDDDDVSVAAVQPPTTPPPTNRLPETGSTIVEDVSKLAGVFILLGGVAILLVRRRRQTA